MCALKETLTLSHPLAEIAENQAEICALLLCITKDNSGEKLWGSHNYVSRSISQVGFFKEDFILE